MVRICALIVNTLIVTFGGCELSQPLRIGVKGGGYTDPLAWHVLATYGSFAR